MSNLFVFFVVSASCVSCRRSRKKRTFVDINLVDLFNSSSSVNVLIVYIYILISKLNRSLRVGCKVLLVKLAQRKFGLCLTETENFVTVYFRPFFRFSTKTHFFVVCGVSKGHGTKFTFTIILLSPLVYHGRYCEKK